MARVLTRAKQRQQYRLNGEADAMQTDGAMAPCRVDPAPFIDYDDADDPVTYEAQVTCAGCPFLENCDERAKLERPAWGVWAGNVWGPSDTEDGRGRIVRRQRRRQIRALAQPA